jgi:hypothetical protein
MTAGARYGHGLCRDCLGQGDVVVKAGGGK